MIAPPKALDQAVILVHYWPIYLKYSPSTRPNTNLLLVKISSFWLKTPKSTAQCLKIENVRFLCVFWPIWYQNYPKPLELAMGLDIAQLPDTYLKGFWTLARIGLVPGGGP